MYIQPRQVWLLLPLLLLLFLLGTGIGLVSDKLGGLEADAKIEADSPALRYQAEVSKLLSQLQTGEARPFQVVVEGHSYKGTYQGENFQLTGQIAGHQIEMKRSNSDISISVDGEKQNPALLPYALYTPYEHALLVKNEVTNVKPKAVYSPEHPQMEGYKLSLPPEKVKRMLLVWMGPTFQAEKEMDVLLDQMNIGYQLWYDKATGRLHQMVVTLGMDSPIGRREDQLVFGF